MATKIVFILIVCVLLRVSHSLPVLPVSLDVKTVQSSDSMSESGLTERTTVLDSETKLTQSLNTEMLRKPFESFEAERRVRRVSRTKRHITKAKKLCPADMIEYAGQCLTKEKYEENYDY